MSLRTCLGEAGDLNPASMRLRATMSRAARLLPPMTTTRRRVLPRRAVTMML